MKRVPVIGRMARAGFRFAFASAVFLFGPRAVSAAWHPCEFDDNSLTLVPGETRELVFTAKDKDVTLEKFKAAFSVKHLEETTR